MNHVKIYLFNSNFSTLVFFWFPTAVCSHRVSSKRCQFLTPSSWRWRIKFTAYNLLGHTHQTDFNSKIPKNNFAMKSMKIVLFFSRHPIIFLVFIFHEFWLAIWNLSLKKFLKWKHSTEESSFSWRLQKSRNETNSGRKRKFHGAHFSLHWKSTNSRG